MSKLALMIFILMTPHAFAKEQPKSGVPMQYQGHWASDLKHCGQEDVMNLTITSTYVKAWESEGRIVSIVKNGQHEIAFISALTGEGETWLAFHYYRLSNDKRQLTDISDALTETPAFRYRCPSKK
ncbi:MAG: hypothetical protein KAG26_06295 [Methylococcales bacterium]|nr:hypothetical protein [Methylococcales bacterium]